MENFLKYKNSNLSEKIVIVTATAKSGTNLFMKKPLGLFLEKTGWDKRALIVENNREGLSKVYNRYLTEEFKDKYVVFIHDDVLIDDLFFEEKVLLAFEKYSVIGLAGTKSCNLNAPMTAWHLMSNNKEDMVGEVSHSDKTKTWTTVFGPTDSRALLLDGLFIGVDVNVALEKGLKFDERFSFHHYDLTFSLKANELKIKAGVFPLNVVHYGLGDSMNTEAWHKSNELFKSIYKGE